MRPRFMVTSWSWQIPRLYKGIDIRGVGMVGRWFALESAGSLRAEAVWLGTDWKKGKAGS